MVYQSSPPPALDPPYIFKQNKKDFLHRMKISSALKKSYLFHRECESVGEIILIS